MQDPTFNPGEDVAIADALTEVTGEAWEMLPPREMCDWVRTYKRTRDGLEIYGSRGPWNKKHLRSWAMSLPKYRHADGRELQMSLYHDETHPRINVSREKSAQVIAKDLARRLIPDASELYAKMIERRDGWNRNTDNKNAAAEKFAKILGTTYNPNDRHRVSAYHRNHWSGSVEATTDGARFEINVDNHETAAAICGLLAALAKD